jgi:hypothetical protein
VSGKVDVPGRTEAAGGLHHRLLPGLLARPEPQLQLDALHAHGYDQLFAEKESGKHGVQRPEFSL